MADNLALKILISARDTASGALRSLAGVLGDVRVQVGALVGSFGLLKASQDAIGISSGFEDLRVQMAGLLGSADVAKLKLKELEDAFGLRQLDQATQVFIKMKTYGMDPTIESIRALIDYNARMGMSAENLTEIITQLGQAYSSGTLLRDESKVLMERGVLVYDLLAKATGKTTAEIQAMQTASLLGRDAISLLIDEMGRVASGASVERLKTWTGLVESAAALWRRFVDALMAGGAFDYAKSKLSEIAEVLEYAVNSGAARRWGEQIGEAVTSAGAWAEKLTGFVRQIVGGMQLILNAAAAAINGTIALVSGSVARLADLVAGLPKLFWQAYPELKQGLDAFRQSAEETFQAASDRSREAIDGIKDGWSKINEAPSGGLKSIVKDWQDMYDTAKAYNAEVAKSRQGAAAVAAEMAKAKTQAQGLSGASGGSGSKGSATASTPGGPDTYDSMTAEQKRIVRAELNARRNEALARFREQKISAAELGAVDVDIAREELLTMGVGKEAALRRQQAAAAKAAVPNLDSIVARVKIEIDPEGKAEVDAFKRKTAEPVVMPVKPEIVWGDVTLGSIAVPSDKAQIVRGDVALGTDVSRAAAKVGTRTQ